MVKCNAPIRFHHKLLLQPKFALEIFYLCQECDYLFTDTFYRTHLCKITFCMYFVICVKVIEMHHFVLDKEIKFTCEEST